MERSADARIDVQVDSIVALFASEVDAVTVLLDHQIRQFTRLRGQPLYLRDRNVIEGVLVLRLSTELQQSEAECVLVVVLNDQFLGLESAQVVVDGALVHLSGHREFSNTGAPQSSEGLQQPDRLLTCRNRVFRLIAHALKLSSQGKKSILYFRTHVHQGLQNSERISS